MKVGDKFVREIYTGNSAEITVTSVDEQGYRYEIAFPDGRKGAGFKSWTERDTEGKAENADG
ncbi:MAG: hypothetical protein J6Y92_04025 [Lentisphaeria bacterium]|nr:hypothetical protein [Lentisphaeria bacterium]